MGGRWVLGPLQGSPAWGARPAEAPPGCRVRACPQDGPTCAGPWGLWLHSPPVVVSPQPTLLGGLRLWFSHPGVSPWWPLTAPVLKWGPALLNFCWFQWVLEQGGRPDASQPVCAQKWDGLGGSMKVSWGRLLFPPPALGTVSCPPHPPLFRPGSSVIRGCNQGLARFLLTLLGSELFTCSVCRVPAFWGAHSLKGGLGVREPWGTPRSPSFCGWAGRAKHPRRCARG